MFLYVAQTFDKVWHEDSLYKIKTVSPFVLYKKLESYLSNRKFTVKVADFKSDEGPIRVSVFRYSRYSNI